MTINRVEWKCRCLDPDCEGKTTEPDQLLVASVDLLSDKVNHAILLTSGLRCGEHNRAEGGSENSHHLPGRHSAGTGAADIKCVGVSVKQCWLAVTKSLPISQMGIGINEWGLHIDIRGYHKLWIQSKLLTHKNGYTYIAGL